MNQNSKIIDSLKIVGLDLQSGKLVFPILESFAP